jgi:hypothetical protein
MAAAEPVVVTELVVAEPEPVVVAGELAVVAAVVAEPVVVEAAEVEAAEVEEAPDPVRVPDPPVCPARRRSARRSGWSVEPKRGPVQRPM